MRFIRKHVIIFSAAAVVGSSLFISGATAAPTQPTDVSSSLISCDSNTVSVAVKPVYTNSTGATTFSLTVSGNLGGCTTNNPAALVASGTLTGTLSMSVVAPSCNSLLQNVNPAVGNLKIVWKTSNGTVLSPSSTTFVGASMVPGLATVNTLSLNSPAWPAVYPLFKFGGQTLAGSAFNGGNDTFLAGVSSIDNDALAAQCANGGIKALNFGMSAFITA